MITVGSFRFGRNNIAIPGFKIVSEEGQWTFAEQGENRFFVEEFPDRFRLSPVGNLPGGKTCALTDRAIDIPKDR